MLSCLIWLGLFMLNSATVSGQRILINTLDSLYELNGAPGTCTINAPIPYCAIVGNDRILSTALYNDTLYFISGRDNELYRSTLGDPGSCILVADLPDDGSQSAFNAMTVDLYGNVYGLSGAGSLFYYKAGGSTAILLGKVPQPPGGDMLYHDGKLLYAALSGELYEINVQDPAGSSLYMSTRPHQFIGLISFPYDCDKNKVYGITGSYPYSQLVELDLDNRTVAGVVCTLPVMVYDAASIVEDGKTQGILIDSIALSATCDPAAAAGSIRVHAFTAAAGALSYELDGTPYPNGNFTQVGLGAHTIRIKNSRNCIRDTTVILTRNIPPDFQVNASFTPGCAGNDGTIEITQAVSDHLPLLFRIDGKAFSPVARFTGLPAGDHTVTVLDASLCARDTVIRLIAHPEIPQVTVSIVPPGCNNPGSGSVSLHISGSGAPYTYVHQLKSYASGEEINNLASGVYRLAVFSKDGCVVDTAVIRIPEADLTACRGMTMPNAFTPNGDGRNDFIKPQYSGMNSRVEFTIYNRYGQIVYTYPGVGMGWDGNVGGKPQPSGGYIWKISYRNNEGEFVRAQGVLMLVR